MTNQQAFEALQKLPFDFQIGGSLGLKMFGIINREIKDIDIVVSSLDIEYFADKPREEGSGEEVVIIRDGDVKIEVYEGIEDFIEASNQYGRWKVSLPNYAIKAKKKYVAEIKTDIERASMPFGLSSIVDRLTDRLDKHQKDIDLYEDWRNGGLQLQKAIDDPFAKMID